jgi:MFS family permease
VRSFGSWPLGRLADRLGRRRTLLLGWSWQAVCYAGFALATERWHAWALFAAYGLVAGLTEGAEKAVVAASVPSAQRGRALGVYNLVQGAGLFVASILAGQLWERASPGVALGTGAAFALAGALVLYRGTRASQR